MAFEHGQGRTEAELKRLLADAGLHDVRLLPHGVAYADLIEARR